MSAQDQDIFRAFSEAVVAEPEDSSADDMLETVTYIAFLLEKIDAALENPVPQPRSLQGRVRTPHQPATANMERGLASTASSSAEIRSPRKKDSAREEKIGETSPRGVSTTARQVQPQAPRDAQRKAQKASSDMPLRSEAGEEHSSAARHLPAASAQNQQANSGGTPSIGMVPARIAGRNTPAEKDAEGGAQGKTKSQAALESVQSESAAQKQGTGLLDVLKKNLAEWDGTAAGQSTENLADAAGMAAGGPLFAAVKDIERLVETDKDDKSLLGVMKQVAADKTGVTAAKDWVGKKRDSLTEKIQTWAGTRTGGSQAQAAGVQTGGAQRDAQGRFLPKTSRKTKVLPPQPTEEEKEQLEFTESIFTTQVKEAKAEERRHEELIRAINKGAGGGILDKLRGASDALRGRGGRRGGRADTGRGTTGRGRAGRQAVSGELARRAGTGRSGAVGLGRGTGLLGRAGEEAGGGALARGGSRLLTGAGAGLRAGPGLGARAMGGAARLIPGVGQILAAGMAIADGIQGFNDTAAQQEAFGLREGQEATTGQKASMAAANVLDMGGLFTGAAQMFGVDIDTGDIAKTMYGAVSCAEGVIGTITGAASGIGSLLADGFSNLTSTIGTTATDLWTSASSAVSSTMATISGAAVGLLDSATSTVDNTLSAISAKSAELWNTTTTAVANAASATGEKAAELWDATKETVAGVAATVADTASSAWNATTESVANVAAAAKEEAASLLDSTLTWFGFGDKNKETSPVPKEQSGAETSRTATPSPAAKKPQEPTPSLAATVPAAQTALAAVTTLPVSPAVVPSPQAPPVTHEAPAVMATRTTSFSDDTSPACAVMEPGENMTGLLDSLILSLDEFQKVIETKLENEGALSSAQGLLSGVGSWIGGLFSRRGSSAGTGGASAATRSGGAGGTASSYVYDPNAKIGEAIAKYESGTQGSSAIGYDRTGGTSYGKYQLASKAGSMEGFLKMMEGKGGEHAAIAARLRASGPMDTGGKGGAMPEQWKNEAAANDELLQAAEREYMLKENYAPAMQRLGGDLRGRVEGSKALQEAMFSTSVQHGAYGKAGAAGIWNKVYKADMSDEELVRAVYNERATRFGSSTPQIQESAKRRMSSEQELILSMRRGESSTQSVTAAVQNSPQDQAVQAAASASLMDSTADAMNRGVRYGFGNKNSRTGSIDCSGWVAEMNRSMMGSINAAMGQKAFGPEAQKILERGAAGGAAGLVQAVGDATGEILGNADLSPDKVREGMMIGMDTGQKGWDAGRFGGIDHIVQTYRDQQTGRMMVSESRGGKGVTNTDYEEWYEKNGRHQLYGADVTKLADASKIPGQKQTAIAEATPGATTNGEQITLATPATEALVAAAVPAQPVASAQPPVAPAYAAAQGTAEPQRRVKDPELIKNPEQPQPSYDFSRMEQLFATLIEAVRAQKDPFDKPGDTNEPPNIPVEYADAYLIQMAHDRA